MTRNQAVSILAVLPVVQAFAEGKAIEHFFDGEWTELKDPTFTDVADTYRIKREPRVVYSNEYSDGFGAAYLTYEKAKEIGMLSSKGVIKFIEVIE